MVAGVKYRWMGEPRGRVAVGVILAVVAVAVGGLAGRTAGQDSSPSTTTAPEQTDNRVPTDTIRVHVSGMVVAPGVVDVAPDAIVADAIDAAGGVRQGARVDQINLASPVSAGDQIVVPGPESSASGDGESGDGLLSLGRASADEFESLPGVGPVLAERIVAFREENGGFDVVEDLLEVPGIGEAKLAAIRDLVRP